MRMYPIIHEWRRLLFCLLLLWAAIQAAEAQTESADTLAAHAASPAGVKSFDGFLLDMRLMQMAAPRLPRFTLEVPDASKDYSRLFQLNPDITYSQGLSNLFSLGNTRYYSTNPFGLSGFFNQTDNLQMGSFRLKNGMRINTYGQYDKDGWRVPNPSALPWERNNFKGAFELKSSNGAFGIRIEVQQGRESPY